MRSITEDYRANMLREQLIPDHLFIYMLRGAVRIFDGMNLYLLKPGDACIIRKHSLAKYELLESAAESFEPVLFCFDEPFLKACFEKHQFKISGANTVDALIRLKKDTMITSFVNSIKPYYKGLMELDADFEDLKYEELLLILLKIHPDLAGIFFSFTPREKINLEVFMNRNYTFNLRMKDFAALTGRSLTTFKRDFRAIYNETPSKWLIRKRLNEAYFLLSEKREKPSNIYLRLGFESLSHFSVAFKKAFACTPTTLTREVRKTDSL